MATKIYNSDRDDIYVQFAYNDFVVQYVPGYSDSAMIQPDVEYHFRTPADVHRFIDKLTESVSLWEAARSLV